MLVVFIVRCHVGVAGVCLPASGCSMLDFFVLFLHVTGLASPVRLQVRAAVVLVWDLGSMK